MTHHLQEITWEGKIGDPVYLYFSKKPVARTESYLDGSVAVDFDLNGDVIGIEMLDAEPGDWAVLGQIASKHNLRFDLFFRAKKPRKSKSKASR